MRLYLLAVLSSALLACSSLAGEVMFETTSAYHNIRVVDEGDARTLYFDDAPETRMSLQNPLKGQFEYTEFFHMAWLWNTRLTNVLMIGLGGGSAQRSFEHWYPGLKIETVEIDPAVVQVAKDYFHFKPSDSQKVNVEDGRMFLRRSTAKYDLIILDAYITGRYGSSIPQHLATRECFELARDHLTTNGVVAYNVIGTLSGWHADIVGAIYRTLQAVFPQVYLFPARSSQNIVLIATQSGYRTDYANLRLRTGLLRQAQRLTMPTFLERLQCFRPLPPPSAARSPVLTDDYAPVEGLAAAGVR
jgi:spermidine synthase